MNSARYPGKATLDYGAGDNLSAVLRRWRASDRGPRLVVVTGNGPENQLLWTLTLASRAALVIVPQALSDERRVTEMLDLAVKEAAPGAAYVARGMFDNPLVDVELADWRLDLLRESGADGIWYGGNEARITYAGTTDVWGRAAWDRIAAESSGSQAEHPGAYFWDNLNHFKLLRVSLPRREYLSGFRTELDAPEDLAMLRAVYGAWNLLDGGSGNVMPALWALKYMTAHPEVAALNGGIRAKTQTVARMGGARLLLCDECRAVAGTIVNGNFETHCARCGRLVRFYSARPLPRRSNRENGKP